MTKIFLVGANGRMGREILALAESYKDITVVGGLDRGDASIPLFKSFAEITCDYDVLIDFSSPALQDELGSYMDTVKKPAVLCTTGLSPEQETAIRQRSATMPIFRSANMSVGIYVLSQLITEANRLLGPGYDIEIIEKHHRAKQDAPSGTAYLLADAIQKNSDTPHTYITDRSQTYRARQPHEIGISAVRGGSIPGDHDVLFAGEAETITLAHHAESRRVFAAGALRAAAFMKDKPPGLYSMADLLA